MVKFFTLFVAMIFSVSAFANTHVVIVTPRGETIMEKVFKEELEKLLPDRKIRFTLVKPDVNDAAEMSRLPYTVTRQLTGYPDLIYVWGTPTTLALAGTYEEPLIKDIPIVFTTVAYPVEAKLTRRLSSSERNVTGVSHLIALEQQLLTMQQYKKFKKVGVVFNPKEQNSLIMIEDLKRVAQKLNIHLIIKQVDLIDGVPSAKSIPRKIEQLKKEGAEWLYIGADTFTGFTHRQMTTTAAVVYGLPSFTSNESAMRTGNALYGIFSPIENLARLTAAKASEILQKKKKPHEIPIETIPKFVHVVNLCTATSLGIYPPAQVFRIAEILSPTGDEKNVGCTFIN